MTVAVDAPQDLLGLDIGQPAWNRCQFISAQCGNSTLQRLFNIAIMQTEPLSGVVAPPRLVPRTRADQTGGVFNPAAPAIIGVNVRAMATLLTIELAIPLIQRAAIDALNGLFSANCTSGVDSSSNTPVFPKPPTMNMNPAIKNTVSQSSALKISAGSMLLRTKAKMAQPKATASGPIGRLSRIKNKSNKSEIIKID